MIRRIFVAALVIVASAFSRPAPKPPTACASRSRRPERPSWEIELIKARGLDKAANLDIETTELASTEAGKIALEGGGADHRRRGLALGGARTGARRQAPVHALFDRARRGDGAKGFAGPYGRRSRRPVDRRRRRAARQELAPAAGGGARRGTRPRPGTPGPPTARRRSSPRSSPQGETDAALEFWNFSADLEGRGFRRAIEMADVEKALGATRASGDDRLCVQRSLRGLAQGRSQALFRRGRRGAQDPGRRSERLGADQGAAPPERRRGARRLPQALSRRRAEADGRRGGRGRARPLSARWRSWAARSWSARPRSSTPASSTIPQTANSAWRRVSSRSSRSLALWQLAAHFGNPRLLPGPMAVFATMESEAASGALFAALGVTLARVAAAFLLAMAVGIGDRLCDGAQRARSIAWPTRGSSCF